MEIPKNAQKNIVLDIVGKDAGNLLISQDMAKQALVGLGATTEEAEAVLAETLAEISVCYQREYVDKGKVPQLKMSTIVLPWKPE